MVEMSCWSCSVRRARGTSRIPRSMPYTQVARSRAEPNWNRRRSWCGTEMAVSPMSSPRRSRVRGQEISRGCCREYESSTSLQSFQLIERARPVRTQQARQTSVRQHLASGLAAGAIVGFFIGVPNPQNLFAAPRTRQPVASVHGHVFAERGDLLRKTLLRLCAQLVDPAPQSLPRRIEQPLPLLVSKFVRLRYGGKLRRVQDFIGIGVADAVDHPRIGQRPLEGVVLRRQCCSKCRKVRREHVNTARIELAEIRFAAYDVQRGAMLASGLGQHQRSIGKIERREILSATEF